MSRQPSQPVDAAPPCRGGRVSEEISRAALIGAIAGVLLLVDVRVAPAEQLPGAQTVAAEVIQVGPTRRYKMPSEAARVAVDGSLVEIDAGLYVGDVAVWPQNHLTIRGVGGRAHIDAGGKAAEAKAIWVVKGDGVTIENVELSGCRVPDRNGAGIRVEGANFTLRHSVVHGNEMGILTGENSLSDVLIENSEFYGNTVDYQATGSLGHNIYIGRVRSFTLRGSYVHHASIGHNVKTRAAANRILFNRIMDEDGGNSSYLIDIAEGGAAYVIGNVLHKSATADNDALISYAAEGGRDDVEREFYVVSNTAVSEHPQGRLVRNHGVTVARLFSNIFVGGPELAEGPNHGAGNVVGGDPGLADPAGYDYHLLAGSSAIDVGALPADGAGSLWPEYEYRHPASLQTRERRGLLDAGAYEARVN